MIVFFEQFKHYFGSINYEEWFFIIIKSTESKALNQKLLWVVDQFC